MPLNLLPLSTFFSLSLFRNSFDMPEPNAPPLDPKAEVQLSKLLSYLLRHGAVKEKLDISSDGFVAVNDIVSAQ